jgi:hypothetical protein
MVPAPKTRLVGSLLDFRPLSRLSPMRSGNLRSILLALSIEKADGEGSILPADVRQEATREAARTLSREASAAEQDRFFAERAGPLIDHVASHHPTSRPAIDPPARWRLVAPGILIAALIIGWATQALGPEKEINILSFPLIGILLWNLAVYLGEVFGGLTGLHRRSHPVGSESEDPAAAGWIERAAGWLDARSGDQTDAALPPALRQGLADFRRRWRRLRGPVTRARVRAVLHLAAALLAAAALAGMYAKGIANEYRAYWESTFLTPETLRAALGVVLGPASAISGIAIPDVASLAALRQTADTAATAGENAARWIHLHAITILLFVIGPRLVLALWQGAAARRREAAIDPRDLPSVGLYFDRILAEALGTALPVRAVAYCHRLSPTGEAALRRCLEHDLGVPVSLDWAEPVTLGGEETFARSLAASTDPMPAHLVLVSDLAATPEDESHGELIRQTRDILAGTFPETRLHICLDAEAYDDTRRTLPDFSARRADRLAAWRAIAGPLRNQMTAFPPNS